MAMGNVSFKHVVSDVAKNRTDIDINRISTRPRLGSVDGWGVLNAIGYGNIIKDTPGTERISIWSDEYRSRTRVTVTAEDGTLLWSSGILGGHGCSMCMPYIGIGDANGDGYDDVLYYTNENSWQLFLQEPICKK